MVTAVLSNDISLVTTVVSTIAVFLSSSVIFFIAGVLCMRLFQAKSIEDGSEDALDTPSAIQNQLVPIYESVHASTPRNDYEIKENIAYGRIVVQQ